MPYPVSSLPEPLNKHFNDILFAVVQSNSAITTSKIVDEIISIFSINATPDDYRKIVSLVSTRLSSIFKHGSILSRIKVNHHKVNYHYEYTLLKNVYYDDIPIVSVVFFHYQTIDQKKQMISNLISNMTNQIEK